MSFYEAKVMRMWKRFITWMLLAMMIGFLRPAVILGQESELPDQPEILWDTWGVPHIFSPDNEGLFYAFGWAQAQNHGDLILKLYGQARGRAAEYWGEEFFESDKLVRTLGIPGQAEAGYTKLTDEFKTYVDAFTKGFNDYIADNPDTIGEQWKAVLPVMPIDVIGHGIRVLRYTFVAQTGIDYALGETTPNSEGSNGWAIAPSRSASGKAMLVANPHQPWQDLGLWIEAQLVSPDVNVYGAALVGNPVLGIGFNEYLGWTHTVNTHDGWDLYQLILSEDGKSYLYDGEERPLDMREETIQVKQEDGTLKAVPLTIMQSVHGPVLATRDDGTALALRVVGENTFEASQEWWEMGKATNLQEFEDALRPLRIPMFTVIYADRDGNIMHLFNEQVPVRESGDWAFWNNTTRIDEAHPAIIPGDSSDYLWTTYHPYEDLPRIVNPDSGWVQNANEPPWTGTLPPPFNPDDFPAYMLPPSYIWPRPVNSMRMLSEDDSITFDELVDYKQSTYIELADWCLDDLIAVASTSDDELVKQAGDVLAAWDRQTNADSVGAVLFAAWANDYITPLGFAAFKTEWSIDDPLNAPKGLVDPEGAVVSLQKVAQQLELIRLLGGGIDVKYGDLFRLRYGKYDLPANGAADLLGSFRVLTFVQDPDLHFHPVHGDSYIAVVEFSDPVRAKVLLSYGNSTQLDSPHNGDQLELFARKELRDAWLTREAIEANLEAKEVLTESR
jgi:acyl-homoserine-lactone acylase